ncbi:hypothetical protein RUM43_003613 [Polyplax serrata]|uniref:Uncharacterized protein n=1 Tax=Polyplax serrata TaxID=468196 RepID=A0AAN8S3A6_POLSC
MKKSLFWQDNLQQDDTEEEYTFTGGKAGEHQESKENKRTMEAIKVENNMGSGMAERTHLIICKKPVVIFLAMYVGSIPEAIALP